MTIRTVTKQSYGSRLGGAFGGIILGLILLVVSSGMLIWNEGNSVKTSRSLKEGAKNFIVVPSNEVSPANNGKLVYTNGNLVVDEILADKQFFVSDKAVRFKRDVEMFQWKETSKSESKEKLGGSKETVTTYDYEKVWSSSLISSDNFQDKVNYQNPNSMFFKSKTTNAKNVKVGGFVLPDNMLNKLNEFTEVAVKPDVNATAIGINNLTPHDNGFYIGYNVSSPRIGDYKVKFSSIKPGPVSIISKQLNNTFEPYQAKAGRSVDMIKLGNHSAENMFEAAQKSNTMMTWVLRFVGLLLMFFGFTAILRPIAVAGSIVPFLGRMVGAGIGFIGFLLAIVLGFLIIAFSWIAYRPEIGIALLLVAIGAIVLLIRNSKKRKALEAEKLETKIELE